MQPAPTSAAALAERIYVLDLNEVHRRTDASFAKLMPVQWAAAIALALWLSPSHVWMAILFGGLVTGLPVLLARLRPGSCLTRHVVAAGQMLMGSLLIHLSGGRIETHFFLFGSLAFIAFYRDVNVLITAAVVVSVDHVLRGFYLPQSLYGVLNASLWRTVEHAGWMIYEETFLCMSVRQIARKMRTKAAREAEVRISREQLWEGREALAESERENRELIERSPFGTYRSTPDGRIIMANPALVEMLGYGSLEELMALDLNAETSPHPSRRQFKDHIEGSGELRDHEFHWARRDGTMLLLRENARIVRAKDGSTLYYEGMLEDVTERSQMHEQLLFRAHHDALTGLPNRLLLEDRLRLALARAERESTIAAVLCVDLDRFKQVNDAYGHQVGDAFLQEIARRIAGRLRSIDTFARVGGDEFAIVLGDLEEAEDAMALATEILAILNPLLEIEGHSLQPSASIGVALFPQDGCNPEELHRRADQAMYRAKALGRGQCRRFTRELGEESADALDMEIHLRHAIEQGGFELHYQPLVTSSGAVAGMEALLRFRHPRLGQVPPSRFIPVAEQNGMIVPIGEWVLGAACRQNAEWIRSGLAPVPMAVNVSARQLGPGFVDMVARVLLETGLDPALLELELTESFVMADFETSASVIERLKRLGVRIAVDDFGTGYSSLSYLHRLPIDIVKIDHSFIERIAEPGGTRPIVEAILSLAGSLGLRTVAEGVETEEQHEALRELGCHLMQGYLFARPEVASEAGLRLTGTILQPHVA